MKLSFILPVYNVEAYLDECVDSILAQATEDCEIILVDDGATDSSGALCDKRGAESPLIRVVHKENGGLASARNAGLAVAQGDYIAFVDSDDRVANGAVDAMLSWIKAGGADICFMQAIKFFPDGRSEDLGDCIAAEAVRGKTSDEVLSHLATRPKFTGSSCTKIFRRDFLTKHGILFPDDRRLSEDLWFVLDCLLKADTFDALTVPYYQYRQNRAGSITSTVNTKRYFDLFRFVAENADALAPNRKPLSHVARCALSFAAYEYSILLWHYTQLTAGDRPQALKLLKQYKWVMKYAQSAKIKAIGAAANVSGIKLTACLLKWYMARRG